MARYTGPDCRLCRRMGEKLFLKGERCFTPRCAIDRRRRAPGLAPSGRRRRLSDRGVQLQEKQKAKVIYGVLERQFRGYYAQAMKSLGATPEVLLRLLEQRLDNVVYRLDFAESRDQARQLVLHGFFAVDDSRVTIPSYQVRPGQAVAWHEKKREKPVAKQGREGTARKTVPPWLSREPDGLSGRMLRLPEQGEVESAFEPRLIVEYYSR